MAGLPSKSIGQVTTKQINNLRGGLLHDFSTATERRLKQLGAVTYDMLLPETNRLPLVLHPDEEVLGVVYGRYVHTVKPMIGRGVLVATDQRLFLLDTKPLFTSLDEFTYEAIGGITHTSILFIGTVTVHIAGGDIKLRTFNNRAAKNFVEAVESQMIQEYEPVA